MSELSVLAARRDEVQAQLRSIEEESAGGAGRILEAIKGQRWYFFKDNKYILMDRDTGLLWANLDYYENWQQLAEDSKISGWENCINLLGDEVNPCNRSLVANTTYEQDVDPNNKVYSERERLQFTLDLFVKNNLWPKFTDDEITQLYGRLYFDKPALTAQLQELNAQIAPLMAVRVLSSEFDYNALLAKYDLNAVSSSVIKYFQAIQSWADELMSLIGTYEREKQDTISQFNTLTLTLSKKYTSSPDLTREENDFLRERQEFFRVLLSLGMHTVKAKILSLRAQADGLEARIDSTDSITDLAAIQHEQRAGFPLIAENSARIITNALRKIEHFEAHRDFVAGAVKTLTDWSDDYQVFKSARLKKLKDSCIEETIDARVWGLWIADWQGLRMEIERKLQPILERGLKGELPEGVITVLEEYKADVYKFYLEERSGIYKREERSGIYKRYAFAPGAELFDKLETEAELYKLSLKFQAGLQKVIFECERPADRIFILNWAESLLDIPIDEVLAFIADNDLQKVSADILDKFAALKLKNYDEYLSDAEAYSRQQKQRGDEYNSLVFKMRQSLAGQEAK